MLSRRIGVKISAGEENRKDRLEAALSRPWASDGQEVVAALEVSPERGLSPVQVHDRRRSYGPNQLKRSEPKQAWKVLTAQFRSLIVLLLVVAAGGAFAFGQYIDGVAITVVLVLNSLIGFFTELKAVRSVEALYALGSVESRVRRNGRLETAPAEELVPGDIVEIEGGDIITADMRLLQASKLQADESLLTGESLPVAKSVEAVGAETPLAERSNMLFKGTSLTRGSGLAAVVTTGMQTELGRITSLVAEAEEEITPLERRLNRLGRRLIWLTLLVAAAVTLSGLFSGKDVLLMVETGIALAVAAIPEGLPVVATIALARGMWRMAEKNALVTHLSAVETLGVTNVIFTDKTGTLTENRMTITRVKLPGGEYEVTGGGLAVEGEFFKREERVEPSRIPGLEELLRVGALCNNAALSTRNGEPEAVGDPMEVALQILAAKGGVQRSRLLEDHPEVREEAFDSETKKMATFHQSGEAFLVAVKGSAEAVLSCCSQVTADGGVQSLRDSDRERWLEENERMAGDGLRVLALAGKTAAGAQEDPYRDLTLLGLVGMFDPPRREAREAIAGCREAGVEVVMVTGDQAATARHVAAAVSLTESSQVIQGTQLTGDVELSPKERERLLKARIFARVSPENKLDLISLHQANGSIVAMTGDGVNDAPALKKADIGIAMGKRGTQVAQQAADMILTDDAFSTIVAAIEEGRIIFNNIRKFVVFLLSCNFSEIMVVGLAALVNAPLPILPLQILFLNVLTDVFPALALGAGEGDRSIMSRPPRKLDESVLEMRHWTGVVGYGLIITASVLIAFALALLWLKSPLEEAVSVSFLTLAFAQLWHVFNMRDGTSRMLVNDVTRNPFVWGALALCGALLVAAVYVPVLRTVLQLVDPGSAGWVIVGLMSLAPLAAGQCLIALGRKYFIPGWEGDG